VTPPKTARSPRGGGRPALPKVTVGKFEHASRLLERMARENTSVFVAAQAQYLATHREATQRPLKADEAAQVASAMAEAIGTDLAEDPGATVAKIQASGLRAYDEPQPQEVLLAAGVATAPAFLKLVQRFVALIEMPCEDFEQGDVDDRLDEVLDQRVAELRRAELDDARARASRALAHFGAKAGVDGPKAWGILGQTILGSLIEATRMSGLTGSGLSSLTGSAPPTADGRVQTSSTGSRSEP
jgi:hypothetical protein